ncbi:MCE family protein [Nocardia otitidiscaviarum]|uniref:MCE family protein n=1 Tax=Nocardia otitidiscaviarum TaxID=1823 RepID=A0A516NLZ8_9NOCA|nr:MCE family protein [Nocardia otitidiscaviarum]MCP9624935.1 MCE family protein [Nocardia otitidiscaviarum]QDP79932.1 MCE family protein [Nocardia otitidiscaviarum]
MGNRARGNAFELDGRGPSTRLLLVTGVVFLVICMVATQLLLAKSRGDLDRRVTVTALLGSVGDGLPEKSDVKFRGVLVGMVRGVTPARGDSPNIVTIDLKPEHAQRIPSTVSARIVPSNAFAVSSVQLVDNDGGPPPDDGGGGPPQQNSGGPPQDTGGGLSVGNGGVRPLAAGATIPEDRTLPTQLFQTTLVKVRELLRAVGRDDSDRTLGLIRTLADATAGKGATLTATVDGLNRVVDEMNRLSTADTGPSTLRTWERAIATLAETAPDLVDALHSTVAPLRTVAEKQEELATLLLGTGDTLGTVGTAMDNHADQLVNITTQLTPVVGVLADDAGEFPAIMLRLNNVVDTFFRELWTRTGEKLTFTFKLVVSLTPLRLYVRADCPVYGALRGPSCDTAPETTPIIDTMGLPDARAYTPPPGVTLPDADSAAARILLAPLGTPPAPAVFTPVPQTGRSTEGQR